MASSFISDKKVVLVFEDGRYTFSYINNSATDEQMYGLARILNAFQAEKPPLKILSVVSSQII